MFYRIMGNWARFNFLASMDKKISALVLFCTRNKVGFIAYSHGIYFKIFYVHDDQRLKLHQKNIKYYMIWLFFKKLWPFFSFLDFWKFSIFSQKSWKILIFLLQIRIEN